MCQNASHSIFRPLRPTLPQACHSSGLLALPALLGALGLLLALLLQAQGELAPGADLRAVEVEEVDGGGDEHGEDGEDGGRYLQRVLGELGEDCRCEHGVSGWVSRWNGRKRRMPASELREGRWRGDLQGAE